MPKYTYTDAPGIAEGCRLDADRVNDAISLLVESGLAETADGFGGEQFDFGAAMITTRGLRVWREDSTSAPRTEESAVVLKIFVCHSSDDAKLAELVVRLFERALHLRSQTIRCTSVNGHRLEAGVNADECLGPEIANAELFVWLVSPASVKSNYVQFELGARWGAQRRIIPVLAHGVSPSIVAGGDAVWKRAFATILCDRRHLNDLAH